MVARRSLRYPESPGAKDSKNALGRTHSRRHRAGQKHKPKDPFDFSDNSVSSMLGEMGDEEELNESFDPPLHSTVIDAEEELPKRPAVFPATHRREEGRSLNLSETEARGSSSLKSSTKKPRRKLEPISDEFESSEDDIRRKVGSTERTRTQQPQVAPPVKPAQQQKAAAPVKPAQQQKAATPVKPAQQQKAASPVKPAQQQQAAPPVKPGQQQQAAPPVKPAQQQAAPPMKPAQQQAAPPVMPAENLMAKKTRPQGTQPSAVGETRAIQRPLKTQKKVRPSPGRRKQSGSEATDSDTSESMQVWCLEGKRRGDIMELDVILSVFEKTFVEYKQRVESERCCQAIDKFYFKIKGELFRMLEDDQVLRAVKRRNTQMISNMEKKRQRLIEVQDELLRLEPQLKQLQTKYDDLKERKSSLKNSIHFLSNLKQLYEDYSDVQEKEPKEKEEYGSSSLPALLFKARTILGAKKHLKTINYQLEKLLELE
ncbi:centromere protein U [Arvicola amphibius]|uniref:centromere protein U n=1 Tax=Arvicola amphibius TaxID=1047088 RepID=UPI0018E31427|nr:centromere protein U [Arvicola amphibius]